MILYAPAKVNLYLEIKKRRKDGYHNIETLFEKIDIFDKVTLNPLRARETKIKIYPRNSNIPEGPGSLIFRAVELFRKYYNVDKGVSVKVHKRIPVAAGLGGGSSDAAAVLLGLNRLWKVSANEKELSELGKELGADIPFFIRKASFAIGKGIGDKIKTLNWRIRLWHLIVSPPRELLSGDIYKECGGSPYYSLTKKLPLTKIMSPATAGEALIKLALFKRNDLEKAALSKEPMSKRVKGTLKKLGASFVMVSGSGPTVFGLFGARNEAARFKRLLLRSLPETKKKLWRIFIASTLQHCEGGDHGDYGN